MINVKYLSNLSNLTLNKDESNLLGKQLKDIIGFVSKLDAINTKNVELHRERLNLDKDKFLEDKVEKSLNTKTALYNAPAEHNNYFSVGLILKNKKIKK